MRSMAATPWTEETDSREKYDDEHLSSGDEECTAKMYHARRDAEEDCSLEKAMEEFNALWIQQGEQHWYKPDMKSVSCTSGGRGSGGIIPLART